MLEWILAHTNFIAKKQMMNAKVLVLVLVLLFVFTSCAQEEAPHQSGISSLEEVAKASNIEEVPQSSSSIAEDDIFDPYNPDIEMLKENNVPPGYFYYPGYDFISYPIEGKILARKDGMYGYLNAEDFTECSAFSYMLAYDFQEGLAAVCQDGKWGYINTDFEIVIPLKFAHASLMHNNIAVVYSVYKLVWEENEQSINSDLYLAQWAYYDTNGRALYECPFPILWDSKVLPVTIKK